MKYEAILTTLEEAAERLGLKLTYEDLHKGEVNTTGGICLVRGERRIIVHKSLGVREKVEILTDLLANIDTEGVHLPPGVRERLDAARKPESELEEKKAGQGA